ncbi:acyl-CoA thioesterase [Mycolicibacterium rhodesiae NBB3]|uniref:Acyl-CoA thioesterase n=1 Tax=Mycolicibacterium rhodesiae (strain NBB3) TaxID=710685 RepID=G8RN64_MYCRN|nr:acyl-CoA thioesterase domain-containing protein [Mycolicibacterium rhodesiae]AEV76258.1 acyl-CoA thioesterase [Mycolicibacterium rhodesiae NBB3]
MSRLLALLDLATGDAEDTWIGAASGPEGKRSYGGQFMAQSLAAAWRTVDSDRAPTNMHLQFLRGGEAGDPVEYTVSKVFDGRTAAGRRVDARQGGRLLTTATVSFAIDLPGPEHGSRTSLPQDPDALESTGPAGPAPSMPLDEIDIRIADEGDGDEFVRRFWWRTTAALPDDPRLHTLVAVYVTDVYMIDPALRVHGHSMMARTHRSGTTDSSIWFHRPVRADEWNLLETTSPAAARGRGVVTGSLIRADGVIASTLVQEGLIAERD